MHQAEGEGHERVGQDGHHRKRPDDKPGSEPLKLGGGGQENQDERHKEAYPGKGIVDSHVAPVKVLGEAPGDQA